MVRRAWVLAVALTACGGSGTESELFESTGAEADAGHDAARGADDTDAGTESDGSAGPADRVCAPGKVEACPCPGGGQGAQACRDDGSGFEPCECSVGDGGVEEAGPDASDPPDTTGWKWWCMRDGDAECSCSYGAVGNENVASCAPITNRTCCYRVHIESRPSLCHCIYDYPPDACDWKAGYHGGTVTATCP